MCLIIIKNLTNNIIIMNDSASILLATSVLALGGLGLYIFRNTHDEPDNKDITNKDITNKDITNKEDKNNEETIFDTSSLFNWGSSDDKDDNKDLDNETEETDVKPRKKMITKTQRNRKQTVSSRRRYY
jgi:hypothetical protein